MFRYRVNLRLIVLNLYSMSINKILVKEFITDCFTESKFDVKYVHTLDTLKPTTQQVLFSKVIECLEQSNRKQIGWKARSKTRKTRKSRKSREVFSKIIKSEFSVLAVAQNRKLGNKKTRNNFSEIPEISKFSEFLICQFFIFFLNFFPFL